MVVLKEQILKVSALGGCSGQVGHHLLWEGMMALEKLIFNSFYFGQVVLKELILTVSTLGGCGHLERRDF